MGNISGTQSSKLKTDWSTTTSSTFKFKKVKPTDFKPKYIGEDDVYNDFYDKCLGSIITKTDTSLMLKKIINNNFLSTIDYAYSYHIPIVFRPDDLWIAIVSAFGAFVNNNAESMRNVFVDHEGKKTLKIYVNDTIELDNYKTPESWSPIFEKFNMLINENVKNDICSWITPSFTTTTQLDKDVCNIILMNTLKKYFGYELEALCGLSSVTLEGTLDDWIALREKVKFMQSFESDILNKWTELLVGVLDQFVNAYQHKIDETFWQSIFSCKCYGSGSVKYGGWMLVFSPFDNNGKYYLNDIETIRKTNCYANIKKQHIVDYIASVPITISDGYNERSMTLCGGIIGTQYDNNTIRTKTGWTIITNVTLESFLNYCNSSINKITTDEIKRLEQLIKISCDIISDKYTDIKFYGVFEYCHELMKIWKNNTMISDEEFTTLITSKNIMDNINKYNTSFQSSDFVVNVDNITKTCKRQSFWCYPEDAERFDQLIVIAYGYIKKYNLKQDGIHMLSYNVHNWWIDNMNITDEEFIKLLTDDEFVESLTYRDSQSGMSFEAREIMNITEKMKKI